MGNFEKLPTREKSYAFVFLLGSFMTVIMLLVYLGEDFVFARCQYFDAEGFSVWNIKKITECRSDAR